MLGRNRRKDKKMKVSQILDKIDEHQLFVPAFQREYVWKKEDAKNLINSLINNYPTGTLLTWETNTPPELKGAFKYTETQGAIKLILDGQQRITTLYLLIRNSIPPYYKESEIEHDPRGLFVKVDQKCVELQYPNKTMENNPVWVNITDILQKNIRSRDVIKSIKAKGIDVSDELNDIIDDNFSKIEKICDVDFLEQMIPVKATLKEAIDIFYIVNAGGVNLTDAELALAQISGYWPDAREIFKKKLASLKSQGFEFGLDFIIYTLLGIMYHVGKDMKKLHDESNKEQIQKKWEIIENITLDYLISLLKTHCHIENIKEINHVYALIPMLLYIFNNDNRLSEDQIRKMMRWFLYVQIRERYVSQTPTKLDQDLKIICEVDDPFVELLNKLELERSLKIHPDEFLGKTTRHPLFNLMKLYFKSINAVCLGTGVSLSQNIGNRYKLDEDHIFPSAKLKPLGYDRNINSYKYALAQELTNREILCARENRGEKNDALPKDYLKEVKRRFPNALKLQCIPENEELWELDRYEDFLKARRVLLAEHLNQYLDTFLEPTSDSNPEINIDELLKKKEDKNTEFKSSFRWDTKENRVNKKLEFVIGKTICGFMNSENGGTLLIGVDDEGNILGLENDYSNVPGNNWDGFQKVLTQYLGNVFGNETCLYWNNLHKITKDGKEVCLISVKPSNKPVYIKNEGQEEFYVRVASKTTPLSMSEAQQYIKDRFK